MTKTLHTLPPEQPASVSVLGVRVDRVTQQQVRAFIESALQQYAVSDRQALCQQIITINPEFFIPIQRDAQFRQCINEAALVVPDGIGVVLATHYLGKPAPERITGVDTAIEIAKICATQGYRLYLLGAAPGVAELVATRLQALAPSLQIAGTYAGSPDPAEAEAIIERIRDARADALCVAYGTPAQELWIRRHLSRLPVAVAIGVGGAFDIISGRKKRAPKFMRKFGLEWLYRLYREPWRWRRMLALPKFAIQVILKGRSSHDA